MEVVDIADINAMIEKWEKEDVDSDIIMQIRNLPKKWALDVFIETEIEDRIVESYGEIEANAIKEVISAFECNTDIMFDYERIDNRITELLSEIIKKDKNTRNISVA